MHVDNRRGFLRSAAGALAFARGLSGHASERIAIGLIGCGWYGMVDLNNAFKAGGVRAVALCDVDSDHLAKAAAEVEKLQGEKPKTFKHYKELLDTPGLQAVIIATPPHWHALQFIDACEKKLAVYCEKPLAYDIREGRAMVNAARRAGNIVQIGFQRRQADSFREAAEYIRAGNAGRIVQVDAQIHYTAGMKDSKPQDPPPSLDWELWCGPAPKLPYSPNIGHVNWRLEKEYGNGHLVDWGIHLIDAARVMLGESMPRFVQASGGIYQLKGQITTPDTLTAHFEFARCPVVWRHRLWGSTEYSSETSNGMFFFGEKQTVFVNDSQWTVIKRDRGAERHVPGTKGDNGFLHVKEFLDAVRENRQPSCTPEDAFRSTATVQLGMIAYQTGSKVIWDEKTEQIPNSPAASRLLRRAYRAPYKRPV